MSSADPYPVLRMLQSHLEGRLRLGGARLWLSAEAAEGLREIVRMRPRPRPPEAESVKSSLREEPVPVGQGEGVTPVPETAVSKEAEPLTRSAKEECLAEVRSRAETGTAARALGTLRERMVFATGSPMADIVLVGEAPGIDEERQGEPFVGKAGQLLTKVLQVMGLERDQVYITNICKFRPAMPDQGSGNRPPTEEEMRSCLDFVREEIAIIRPKVIVALGGTAITGLLGIRSGVMSARGRFYDFEGVPVMATLHPSYLLRKEQEGPEPANREKRKLWEDMLMVMEKAGLPVSDRQRGFFLPK